MSITSDFDSKADSHFASRGDSLSGSSKQNGSRFEDIKYTFAYDNGLMKEKCGLCKMYFHKSTVCYRVPNHRILELQKKWKSVKEGRRYQSASFLYNMTEVCLFCSQLFAVIPGEESSSLSALSETHVIVDEEFKKLEIKTKLERTDISHNRRAYQSSEVDNKAAYLAVTEPYNKTSKTRREADPWWEVDLGRPYHVHSLSFLISTAIRQKLHASIFILDKPLGFENPFLDSVKKAALIRKEFVVSESDRIRMEPITWELPPNTRCVAIRIQLRGINYLALQEFKAMQGDDMVLVDEADYALTANSYASLAPQFLKEGMLEMMSPDRKKALIAMASPSKDTNQNRLAQLRNIDMSSVNLLSNNIKQRYESLDTWKERVLHYGEIFPEAEVSSIQRIIFKYVCDMNFSNKDHGPLHDHDLMGAGLIQHYPRCDLNELFQRIRSVVRWIQTRTHLKVLGPLLNSENFALVANDPNEHLYHLQSAFKRVEYYWAKKQEAETYRQQMDAQHAQSTFQGAPSKSPKRSTNGKVATAAEARGCSWAQSLLVVALFCTNQSHLIPHLVFAVEDKKVFALPPAAVVAPPADSSPGGGDNADDKSLGLTFLSGEGKSVSTYSLAGSSMELHGGHKKGWLKNLATAKVNAFNIKPELKSIEEVTRDPRMPEFNSSFAEYKFSKFKKCVSREQAFPKTLSMEFARSLVPSRGAPVTQINNSFMEEFAAAVAVDGTGGLEGVKEDDHSEAAGSLHSKTAPLPHRTPISRQSMLTPMAVGRESFMAGGHRMPPRASTAASSTLARGGSTVAMLMRGGSSDSLHATTGHMPPILTRGASISAGGMRSSMMSPSSPMARGASMMALKQPHSSGNNLFAIAAATAAAIASSTTVVSEDTDDFEELFFGDEGDGMDGVDRGGRGKDSKAPDVDFYRVCALCELRLPRASMEIKVFRKHVVKLRSSWDPKLVSKEIRSLDNTISMYNLVNVCLFCSQYFDPDFPDGIAYPVKATMEETTSVNKALSAITSQQASSSQYVPFYDTRYMNCDVDVGAMFTRPRTVESRHRAKRATEIAIAHDRKMASFSPVNM